MCTEDASGWFDGKHICKFDTNLSRWAPSDSAACYRRDPVSAEDNAPRVLRWLLQLFGVSSLFALIFVCAPHAWMRTIHVWVGLGTMPDTPIVWYLARSTSAFYAIMGGLFLLAARDLARYRPVLVYLGWSVTLLGITLCVVDVTEGLPLSWTLSEGPVVILCGAVMLFLLRSVPVWPARTRG